MSSIYQKNLNAERKIPISAGEARRLIRETSTSKGIAETFTRNCGEEIKLLMKTDKHHGSLS